MTEWIRRSWNVVGSIRGEAAVEIWRCALTAGERVVAECRSFLTSEELARADRFVREAPRRQFVIVRGTLRKLLGGYLGCAPGEIALEVGERGKPTLGSGALRFNVSHSGELALLAFSRDRELGVDIERMREEVATTEIARRYFAPGEVKRFEEIPESGRTRAFFQCWTRKEAFIKATGEGLFRALDRFEVDFGPGRAAQLIAVRDDPSAAARWTMCDLDPSEGYCAALAIAQGPLEIGLRELVAG
ncbi:MAG: 4'-phosphopantetheinyl transferase superfamily protein [Planctomycetota bacterium]